MATTMTEIPIKDLALTTAPAGKQLLVRDASAGLQRIDYDQIAKNLVESYGASSLAGKNQSIKAAIDSLNSGLTQHNHDERYYTETEIDKKLNDLDRYQNIYCLDKSYRRRLMYISLDADRQTTTSFQYKANSGYVHIKGLFFTRHGICAILTGGDGNGNLVNVSQKNLIGNCDGVSFSVSSNILTITTSAQNSFEGFVICHGGQLVKV